MCVRRWLLREISCNLLFFVVAGDMLVDADQRLASVVGVCSGGVCVVVVGVGVSVGSMICADDVVVRFHELSVGECHVGGFGVAFSYNFDVWHASSASTLWKM